MECVSLFVQTSSTPCWLLSPSHWHFFSWVHHLPHANLRLDLLTLYQKQHWKDPHSSRPYSISPLSLLNPTSFFYYIPTGVIFINLNKHLHYPGKSCVWKWLAIHQGTCSWEGHWGGPKHGAAVHAQLPEGVVLSVIVLLSPLLSAVSWCCSLAFYHYEYFLLMLIYTFFSFLQFFT